MTRSWPAALLASSLLVACAGQPSTKTPAPPHPLARASFDGHARLDRSVTPRAYDLDLHLDPSRDTFNGTVRIDVDLSRPTRVIRMHAQDMALWKIDVHAGVRRELSGVSRGDNGALGLHFADELPAGPATLTIVFDAAFQHVPSGVFRVEQDGAAYVFTQFEALDARRGFPCFDQPEFKTPYRVTIHAPRPLLAVGNAPARSTRTEGDAQIVEFQPTLPIPSYLVAFAVGPFEVVEAPKSATSVPLRVVAPRTRGALAAHALRRTPPLMRALEAFLGEPFPFPKLDLVGVPGMGFAMENVGLITFDDGLLLIDDRASAAARQRLDAVIAHEVAHGWFGNDVTLSWWDDLWLNEAFATFMTSKVLSEVAPESGALLDADARTRRAMHLDALPHARAIRQKVRHGGDVENAFDAITYLKGAAVLRMVESWVGDAALRDALRAYVREHRFGTADTQALLATLDRVTNKPVSRVVPGFVDAPGVPWIRFDMRCNDGKASIRLTQVRHAPLGAPAAGTWKVPVCMRVGWDAMPEQRICVLLDTPERDVPLPDGGCPAWVVPNADQNGYYRWGIDQQAWSKLVRVHLADLGERERAALPDQLGAALEAGDIDLNNYLVLLSELSAGAPRHRLLGVIDELFALQRQAVTPQSQPLFARFARSLLGPHADRLGTERRPAEPEAAELLRPTLLRAMALLADDDATFAVAAQYTERLLADPSHVDAALAELWLPLAARRGDQRLWTAMKTAASKQQLPSLRASWVHALGSFEDDRLARASLSLVIDGSLRPSDFPVLSQGSAATAGSQAVLWSWTAGNYDRIVRRLGESAARRLPGVASSFCDAARASEVESFFAAQGRHPPGTERNLHLTLETIRRCDRMRTSLARALPDALERALRHVPGSRYSQSADAIVR